ARGRLARVGRHRRPAAVAGRRRLAVTSRLTTIGRPSVGLPPIGPTAVGVTAARATAVGRVTGVSRTGASAVAATVALVPVAPVPGVATTRPRLAGPRLAAAGPRLAASGLGGAVARGRPGIWSAGRTRLPVTVLTRGPESRTPVIRRRSVLPGRPGKVW